MSITPLYINDTPLIHNTFTQVDDYGNVSVFPLPNDLTKFSMFIVEQDGTLRVGSGTWSNLNTTAGTADYQAGPTDTSTAGVCRFYPVVALASGPRTFDPQKVTIKDPTKGGMA